MGDFDRYWAIDEWGSHPDEGNDDLWTGTEPFRADETDARAFFKGFSPTEGSSTMYLVLVKLDAEKSNVGDPVAYRRNPGYRKTKDAATPTTTQWGTDDTALEMPGVREGAARPGPAPQERHAALLPPLLREDREVGRARLPGSREEARRRR